MNRTEELQCLLDQRDAIQNVIAQHDLQLLLEFGSLNTRIRELNSELTLVERISLTMERKLHT